MPRLWTGPQVGALRRAWDARDGDERALDFDARFGETIGRPGGAVTRMRARIGLLARDRQRGERPAHVPTGFRWSKADRHLLREAWATREPSMSARPFDHEIAARIGRSAKAVRRIRQTMGLHILLP